jgi:hypothetical protein
MLGDLIYEHTGKLIGQMVLDSGSGAAEEVIPKIDATFSADAISKIKY